MDAITRQLARDLKTAAEIAFAGLIIAFEGTVLLGAMHYIAS